MKILSRKDIEQIATRVVTAYCKLPEFQGKPVHKIDPDVLITQLLGLNIEYHHLSLNGLVLGVTTPSEEVAYKIYDVTGEEEYYIFDGNTILVERDLKDDITKLGRCHFTAVHEASHQIFKMLYPKEYGGLPNSPNLHFYMANSEAKKPIADWEEWQANTLCSAILMQEEMVGQAMMFFGLGERLKLLNKVYAPIEYQRFSDMADFLGVSKKALSIRLRQLGMLDHDYLDNPYALTDVWCDGGI